ncbi:phage protein GemA/Gp16 family protein [Brucella pituitosa]|uniref:phage protein GemA/Gp16 family protein n=1 Tax=Brucella pituitosa TaxID=571256 RepID=UPI003F4A8C17
MNTIAVINIACQQLGLDDETKRALYARVTRETSLRAMSERQRLAVVDELKRLGFKMKTGGKKLPVATKAYIRLIHALWRSCHQKGIIRDGSRSALRTFVKGHSEIDDPDFLTYQQADPIIKALKAMEKRGAAAA